MAIYSPGTAEPEVGGRSANTYLTPIVNVTTSRPTAESVTHRAYSAESGGIYARISEQRVIELPDFRREFL